MQVEVIDDRDRNRLPTGYVLVGMPEGATDRELADAAGYGPRHFGYTVARDTENRTATVALWND